MRKSLVITVAVPKALKFVPEGGFEVKRCTAVHVVLVGVAKEYTYTAPALLDPEIASYLALMVITLRVG